jgi:adenylate cyclase class 1
MKLTQNNERSVLFENRKLFLRFNQCKIDQARKVFSEPVRTVFLTIPRLLHVNQAGLPGYVEDGSPCGIFNYTIDRQSQFNSEKLFPDHVIRRTENLFPVIHSLLLVGSMGSIAQNEKSDLDYTLLVDKSSLSKTELDSFQKKLTLIEEWTWEKFHLETHFFINDFEDVKNNNFGESDSESTGSALAKLLKEEIYRTLILVAGKIPFWWIVPVETTDEKYENLYRLVNEGETLLDRNDFIDIGNVADISNGEYFGGSIWALIKSFKSPFKTLMKMGLLEEYMFSETTFNLLCHQIKKKVFSGDVSCQIDPYLMLFKRVEEFFQNTKSDKEIDALRIAFYMKTGSRIDLEELKMDSRDTQQSTYLKLLANWDWSSEQFADLNTYSTWQMKKKTELGSRINHILMGSYKNISEKNKNLGDNQGFITEKDTHLLGRKLYSFYGKSANKIENQFALVDGKTAEDALTFFMNPNGLNGKTEWLLIRGITLANIADVEPDSIIKSANSLQYLLAFTALNQFFKSSTKLLIRPENLSITNTNLKDILTQLNGYFGQLNIAAITNEDLLSPAQIFKLFLITDFGPSVPLSVFSGIIGDCKTNTELNQFIDKRMGKIKSATAIYLNSWGELFCRAYSGFNCMKVCLNDLSRIISNKKAAGKYFLQIYIPNTTREELRLPWLNRHVVRTLRNKKVALTKRAAS